MTDSTKANVPEFKLGAGNTVIHTATNALETGIVVLNSNLAESPADESTFVTLKRWSEFRQSHSEADG